MAKKLKLERVTRANPKPPHERVYRRVVPRKLGRPRGTRMPWWLALGISDWLRWR